MTKILYRANPPGHPDGPPEANYIEAETEREAVAALKAQGYTGILLYEFAAAARLRKEREKFNSALARANAISEIEMYEAPGWKALIRLFWRSSWWCLPLAAAFIAGAAWSEAWWPLVVGIGLLSLVGYIFWQFRAVMDMVRQAEAFAVGDWATVRHLGGRLRKARALRQTPTGPFEVEAKIAYAEIAQAESAASEPLATVLRRLETWQGKIPVPGLYENLLALLYHKAEDYPGYVASMRRAGEVQRDSPMTLGDWALAEARLGDVEVAASLLDEIDPEILPAPLQAFHPWLAGVIALREDRNEEALAHLQAAVDSFLAYGKNPLTWPPFALCAGACALALARAGKNDAAKKLVQRVWPILKAHGDRPLLTMIKREVMG